jgi:hypothetical protein
VKKCIPVLLAITAIGILAYWADFFLMGTVKARQDNVYLSFQSAFPLADFWLTFCLIMTALSHFRCEKYKKIFFGLLSSSSMIFLALIDFLFNLNQGIYKNFDTPVFMETTINIWLVSLGIITAICIHGDLKKIKN